MRKGENPPPTDTPAFGRRSFAKRLAAMIAAVEVGFDIMGVGEAYGYPARPKGGSAASPGGMFPCTTNAATRYRTGRITASWS